MKHTAFAALLGLSLACASASASAQAEKVLEFDTMAGVSGAYVGPANPIRGISGGGLPWRLDEAKGELRRDGRLEVRVRGLVLAAGPSAGTNTQPTFRAAVSCQVTQVVEGTNVAAVTNVFTGEFPATATGDSDIEAQLTLPAQCIAPIIFVTNAAGRWFSATGF